MLFIPTIFFNRTLLSSFYKHYVLKWSRRLFLLKKLYSVHKMMTRICTIWYQGKWTCISAISKYSKASRTKKSLENWSFL